MRWRSTPKVPSTTPSGISMLLQHRPLLDVQLEVGGGVRELRGALERAVDVDAMRAPGPPAARSPSRSVRPRRSSGSSVPQAALEPNRLRPKRAPSSSAQSTSRTVTGGVPSRRCGAAPRPADHVQAAVEPAAVRHRVDVPADQQLALATRRAASPTGCRPRRPRPRPAAPSSLSRIQARAVAQVSVQRDPLRAVFVAGERAQRAQLSATRAGSSAIGASLPRPCLESSRKNAQTGPPTVVRNTEVVTSVAQTCRDRNDAVLVAAQMCAFYTGYRELFLATEDGLMAFAVDDITLPSLPSIVGALFDPVQEDGSC